MNRNRNECRKRNTRDKLLFRAVGNACPLYFVCEPTNDKSVMRRMPWGCAVRGFSVYARLLLYDRTRSREMSRVSWRPAGSACDRGIPMGNLLRGSRLDSHETGFKHVRTTRSNAFHASHAFERRARACRSRCESFYTHDQPTKYTLSATMNDSFLSASVFSGSGIAHCCRCASWTPTLARNYFVLYTFSLYRSTCTFCNLFLPHDLCAIIWTSQR